MAMNFITPEYPLNWDDIRIEVLELDHHMCQKCGSMSKQLHLHHIIPLSERGSNDAHNLVTLCEECFKAKQLDNALKNMKHSSYLYCERCDEKYGHETGLVYCPHCESFLKTCIGSLRGNVDHDNSDLVVQHDGPHTETPSR
jgi:hypothetical protein